MHHFLWDRHEFHEIIPFDYNTQIFDTKAGDKEISFSGRRRAIFKWYQKKSGYNFTSVLRISFPTSGDEAKINYEEELCNHQPFEADTRNDSEKGVLESEEVDGWSAEREIQPLLRETEPIEIAVETLELD